MTNSSWLGFIDVNHWRGRVDWSNVRNNKPAISGAWIKATEGIRYRYTDYYKYTSKDAKAVGIPWGAFHYFSTAIDPVAQAEYFMKVAGDAPLIPMLDLEEVPLAPNLADKVEKWLYVVEQGFKRPVLIYTGPYYWNDYMQPSKAKVLASKYPLWIANYGVSSPRIPRGWTDWTIWQWTKTGRVSGVSGDVDVNWCKASLDFLKTKGVSSPPLEPLPEPITFVWPTQYKVLTQAFGANPEYYSRFRQAGHEGLDMRAPIGSEIYACADGTVYQSYFGKIYGNQVRIKHTIQGKEIMTIYAHLQRSLVSAGQFVEAGQKIGLADATGNVIAGASHLHLSVKIDGEQTPGYAPGIVDPTKFFVELR